MLLFAVAVPWYWPADYRGPLVPGLPLWVAVSLAASRPQRYPPWSWRLACYDVTNAFPHADEDEEVYVLPPPDLRVKGMLWRMMKMMYGRRKASHATMPSLSVPKPNTAFGLGFPFCTLLLGRKRWHVGDSRCRGFSRAGGGAPAR